ncbi:hypothetical protein JL722_366 [Aureococcus anophagefferens]|nr:hypothetical protein JL722_366 [Aureococcus anophagefferens]
MADADYPSKVLQRALSTADYLASRNLDGLAALKRHCAQTSGKEGDHPDLPVAPLPDGWPRAIPLKGACMTGSLATLAYLFERGADPDLVGVALFEAGLVSPAPGEHHLVNPVFPRALRWLDCATLEDVRALERDDVSRVEGPSSSERRELWLFCCAARKRRDDAVAEARAAAAADVERDEARRREAARSRLASIMPFAPVGNLIDTEVRQRRVKRSASSRVRMTMRGLPEPTDAVRERRRARQIADMELAAARERENAKLEVSRAILEKMACGRVATRLGAVLEDAREKRVRDLAATAIQAWARGLRAKEKRRIVRKLSRFVPLTLWRRRERNRLAAKQLRKFFLDHERPARVKRHIHDFLRAGKLVQRIYRGYAACTVAAEGARCSGSAEAPRRRASAARSRPSSPATGRRTRRAPSRGGRSSRGARTRGRREARDARLARLDRQWDVVDARMAHLVRPEEAPAKRRKEQKWAMPAKVRDAVLRAILGDARARHQATWDVSQREKYRSAPEVFTRRQARTILRLGDIKKRAAPLPPNAKAGKAWPTLFLFVQGDDTLAAIVARAYAAAYAADKEVHLRGGGADVAAAALRALGLVK